ncbi:MAG TPA: hypothetical protein VK041_10655 [Opitutales bacterium]|nr:hypothetical protein [Opitutales bacterium]
MNFINPLKKTFLVSGFFIFSALFLHAQSTEDQPWRTWASANGDQIEAYLKDVSPDGNIVIVRRDGREFTVPLDRFSEADREYVREWQQSQPSMGQQDLSTIDFRTADAPDRYEITGVEQVRVSSREPPEAGAIQSLLQFHGIPYDPSIGQQLAVRKQHADELIAPSDIEAVLSLLPVEIVSFVLPNPQTRELGGPETMEVFNAIKKAISLDLPVLIGYRPEIQIDTPEFVAVATQYDRRTLFAIESGGSRKAIPLDWRTLEESLVQAMIIYPKPTATEGDVSAAREPSREFLSQVSSVIRAEIGRGALALTERLQEENFTATLKDVNRSDLRTQLGNTRSFARQGGVPQIAALLEYGSVAIVPQEYDSGNGFALIYGKDPDGFNAVQYFPNGEFSMGTLSEADLARRWITREDRTYRLDLIDVTIPATSAATESSSDARQPQN